MAREMNAEQLREFLSRGTRTAKLATTMRDGSPHVMPVWFVLEGDALVFNTHADTVKGRNLTRDPRASILVDDECPPFGFVHMRGRVALSEDPDDLLRTATEIAGRYMGADRAAEFGARNAVAGELVARFTPERVIALTGVSD
jgi:PPOX class probable F420-dependent enzyme